MRIPANNLPVLAPLDALPSRHCRAESSRTLTRCGNWTKPGSPYCLLHQPERTERTVTAPRPKGVRGYARHLSLLGREAYRDALGDLSPLDELALAKALLTEILARRQENTALDAFLLSVPPGGALGEEEDGGFAPVPDEAELAAERLRRNRKATQEDMEVIVAAERVVRVATQAHEAHAGKRVLLQFSDGDLEERARAIATAMTAELLSWLPEILCTPCRGRLAEQLLRERRTEIVAE